MTTITTAKLREIAHYMNTTMHDIRALAVSRGVTIDDTPADTDAEEQTMAMTITQEQFEAASRAYRVSGNPDPLLGAFIAAGITIAPPEPPEAMVRLAREIADRAAGYCDPALTHPCEKAALAALQHVVDVVKPLVLNERHWTRETLLDDLLHALGAA